jgi:hypothetical protein
MQRCLQQIGDDMKKKVFGLVLGLVVGSFAMADGLYRDSVTYTIRDSLSITNPGLTAIQFTALEYTFNLPSTGLVSISRIRSSVTNLLVAQAFTNATSAYANQSSLQGSWFAKNDILYLQTGLEATSTNSVVVTVEESR